MRLLLVSAAGIGLFVWPFAGLGLPASAVAATVALVSVLALAAVEIGNRHLDSRQMALLASIAAIDTALRVAVPVGIAGFSPMFPLILCAGYVLGPSFGFVCGSTVLLVSAVATGGAGPWLPYQIFGAGWVGVLAGIAGVHRTGMPGRRDIVILSVAGAVSGFAYGAVLDLWDWSFFPSTPDIGWAPGMPPGTALAHFARYYVSTSMAYDAFRATGNALAIIAVGPPILVALRRFQRRFHVTIEEPPPRDCGVATAASGTTSSNR